MAKKAKRKGPPRDRAAERKHSRTVGKQRKAEAVRAKYGPSRKPAPVTVRSLESGEVLEVVDQNRFLPRPGCESLDVLAQAAGFASYAEYLDSGYWRGVRVKVLGRDRHRCFRCQASRELHVHHVRYDFLGDERLEFLKTVCARCHRKIHGR